MKKLMSVFVLLMFVGSLIIMTGCFGGDDGIGAIIGVAVFVLAISATGGSGAAVFAANTRDSLKPAVSLATDKPTFVVYPLNADGTKASATGYTVPTDKITEAAGQFKADLEIQDNYNQYQVEVYANGKLLTKGIQPVATTAKTGATTKVATTVDTVSTAKAMIYSNWQTTATRRLYSDFSYNLDKANAANPGAVAVTTIATNIDGTLNTWAATDKSTAPDFSAAELTATTEATDVPTTYQVYSIAGTVYRKDGTALDGAQLRLYGMATNTAFLADFNAGMTITANASGYFTNDANHPLPAGGYVLYPPSLPDHAFNPCCRYIEITNADLTGLNFNAYTPTNTGHVAVP
ncbi:MAG: hypothetical protein PHD82_17675 [Candidatus Riflebacteria bacterium]|nr:hypothetical protein [Candidatus Riflebacteria bacterium]